MKIRYKDNTIGNMEKIYTPNNHVNNTEYAKIEQMLEKEKAHNKTEAWSKLDRPVKHQKLQLFAEKYGKNMALSQKDIKTLQVFFSECLEKNKLQKAKEVIYDKELQEIVSIPALHFNVVTKNYTLRIVDPKRVSTLKFLTPKRAPPPPQEDSSSSSSSSSI